MKILWKTFYLTLILIVAWGPAMAAESPRAAFSELALKQAHIDGGFWGPRRELLRTVTMPAQWQVAEWVQKHVDPKTARPWGVGIKV